MGTCSGLKCAQIHPNSLVEELATANKYIGITYCTESCGGIGCSCGFPSSGCLFYRVYHVPVNDAVYEVFHCPTWNEKASITFEQMNWGARSFIQTVELKQNVQKRLGRTNVQLAMLESAHMPVLSDRFIRGPGYLAKLQHHDSFSYACWEDTGNPTNNLNTTRCSIRDTCSCKPAEDSINCYCTHNNVSKLAINQILPIKFPNAHIQGEGQDAIVTLRTVEASAELLINLDLNITNILTTVDDFKCDIPSASIQGCYNCIRGAITYITCTSDIPKVLSEITCESQSFVAICSPRGHTNEIRFYSNRAMSDRKDIVEQDSEMCVDHTEDVEDELKIAEEEKQGSSQMDPPSSRPPTTAFVQGVTAQQMPSAAPVLFVPPQMCAPPQVVCPGMQIMQTAMATIRQEINELRKEIKLHRQERKRKRAEKETHISRKKMKGSVDYLVDHFEDCILTANAKPERSHVAAQVTFKEEPSTSASYTAPMQLQPVGAPQIPSTALAPPPATISIPQVQVPIVSNVSNISNNSNIPAEQLSFL
ncbi:hypothetical protein COOONC_10268 [Cooperia oncophora]